jgi:hypothetical protein
VADIKKYDKLKAVRIHYADYKSAWANSRELKFSSVFHNDCKTLGLFHEIAVGINAGEEISKAVLLDRTVDPGNAHFARGYCSCYFSFLHTNKIFNYSTMTRKWSRGVNYDKYFNDIESCYSKKYKISLLEK